MPKEKLKKEYTKIQNYLKKHHAIEKKYNNYLDDMYGISIYRNQVYKILKDLKIEEDYDFFGKILVKLSVTSISGKNNKIGDLVDNIENFMPIKTEEDFIQFQNLVNKNNPSKENEEDIINRLNNKTKTIMGIKENIFKIKDIEGLLEEYNSEVSLDIIKKLETKLTQPFTNRSKELKDKYKNKALLLQDICGISKNMKGSIKNKETSRQWETNKQRIGFKIS